MTRPAPILCSFAVMLILGYILTPSSRADEVVAKLKEYMDAAVEVEDFHGAVIVLQDGEALLCEGYGYANIEHQVPNTPQTKFRLASITKQFTAMAILILQERGKLCVNDLILAYLDDPPEAWNDVTIHHLLTHTSGIPNYTDFPDMRNRTVRHPATVDEIIATFRDKEPEFAPGEKHAYSNSGFILLGKIIEEVSGQDYETFLHEAIFDPLGMDDTGCDHNGAILPRRASGYRRMGDDLENASYIDMTWTHAAGVLYSTVEDLAKWDQALREGKLIGPESTEAFSTPFKDDYAYGGRVRDRSGRLEVDHTGSIHGFNTYIVRYPEDGVCVAVLSNVEPTPRFRIARDLAGIVLGESVEFPRAPEVVAIDPEAFDALAGRYQLGPSFFLTATRAEDRYYIEATEHSMLEIFPESETEYFVKFMDARLIFKKDESGQVTHVIVRHYDGRELKAEHLDDDPTEATERTEADADEPPARDEASDDEPEAK